MIENMIYVFCVAIYILKYKRIQTKQRYIGFYLSFFCIDMIILRKI